MREEGGRGRGREGEEGEQERRGGKWEEGGGLQAIIAPAGLAVCMQLLLK